MKIALCFIGKFAHFDKCYKSYEQNLINYNKNSEFDIYFNTWNEKNINLEQYKFKIKNIKKINVDNLTNNFTEKMKIFGSLVPYLYKQSVLSKVIPGIKKYDLIFITRFDIRLTDKVDIENLNPNFFYSFSGYTNINKKIDWKNKVHFTNDFINIWKKDSINYTFFKNQNIIMPICDQGFIMNPANYNNYAKIYSLMEIWIKDYDKLSIIKKYNQKIIEWLFKYPLFIIHKYKFTFRVYKFISKLIGFYFPFWVPLEFSIMAKHKPTIYSYHVHLGHNNKVLNFEYEIIGK